ncbi:aldo/keto reductase [Dictyobacter arantiisoli]|uniref:Oxidoreductase n=1 Tax=Dictyobacter arantiisoli TaxID=2014874 RepID=A0A5A5T5Q1_9CHLR|nr:aldo/keto reductase [Dictyobacter arantiisoli]GCF06761.1 oxidoreductase [Dictyobacter arantiisoli]
MTFDAVREQGHLPAIAAGTITLGDDIVVRRMGFGTMRLPGPDVWGEPKDPDEARAVLRRAVELGVNFIDTSAYYGPEVSNRLIAEALYPYPSDLVIATKFGARRTEDKGWVADMTPERLRMACEENLRQLRLEQLHLVHCRYMDDSEIPFAESVGVLAELQREGKIRHIGVSNVSFAQFREAQAITPIVSVQNLYNMSYKQGEELLDACTKEHIAFTPFFPLAMGQLGQANSALEVLAQRYQATAAQISLAWLLARSPQMLVIPGTSSRVHLEENIAAASIHLTETDLAELEHALW